MTTKKLKGVDMSEGNVLSIWEDSRAGLMISLLSLNIFTPNSSFVNKDHNL